MLPSLPSIGRISWRRTEVTNTRPESEQSTVDIAQIEKSFPVPPKSSHSNRKTLPPLPPLAEIEKDAAEAAASVNVSPVSREPEPKSLSPARGGPEKELPLPFGISISHPPKPPPRDGPRPATASTKRLSFVSVDPKRTLKYGTGKHAMVELSPQPSEDPEDPLNWPLWKKNLNFFSLLSMVGIIGNMKTGLISVHRVISREQGVDYTSAAALTAVPLMISSLAGMGSTVSAKVWGKRPVYLVSAVLVFIGSAWDINTRGDYAQNMAARIFQGLGWGAFDTLVLGSILDTFFEHERKTKILVYNIASFTATWGAPLIGGASSLSPGGFSTQFYIFTAFLIVSILLLIMGAPETTYTRSSFEETDTFPMLTRSQSKLPKITLTKDAALQYLRGVKWSSYKAILVDRALLTQALRAAIAPSTLLLFVITMVPHVALWGIASSLSMLFAAAPFGLNPASIGLLFLGPFLLGSAAAAGIRLLLLYRSNFSRTVHLVTLAVGTTFSSIGILGFGLYIAGSAGSRGRGDSDVDLQVAFANNSISFPVVSFLLGLLSLGSAILDGAIEPVVQQSTAFTSANMAVALRNIADMHAGVICLRHLVAGAFVVGMPNVLDTLNGLRASAVGMGVVQIFITVALSAMYFEFGENVKRWDGRVMGLVDLSGLKQRGSFFDTD